MILGRTPVRSAFMLRSAFSLQISVDTHIQSHTLGLGSTHSRSRERLCIERGNWSACIFTGSAGDTCFHPHSVKIHACRHTFTCQSIQAEEQEETVTALSSSICTGTNQTVVLLVSYLIFSLLAKQLAVLAMGWSLMPHCRVKCLKLAIYLIDSDVFSGFDLMADCWALAHYAYGIHQYAEVIIRYVMIWILSVKLSIFKVVLSITLLIESFYWDLLIV